MGIIVKDRLFYISGKSYAYAMYVNDVGLLQHAYYGRHLDIEDIEFYINSVAVTHEPKKDDLNYDVHFNGMPGELGFYARGDYRESTVIAERTDGAAMSRFKYSSHKIFDGAPEMCGLPHTRSGGQTLAVTLKDEFSDLEIVLNYTVFDGVLVRNAELKNTGKQKISIKKAFSFCTDLPDSDFKLLRLCGAWAMERSPVVSDIKQGILRVQSLRGAWAHDSNPFVAVVRKNCSENIGECYGFMLVYSGAFAITAESSFDGSLRIQGGISDVGFCWALEGGERFILPQAVMCYSCEGLGGMSRTYHDFIRSYIIVPEFVYKPRPIVVNNWEATYFDFDNDKLFKIIDGAKDIGADTFVLDDGWFGKRNDDKSGLGDWHVNEIKLAGGLQAVIERCKQNGLKFGLWFEPESISEDSDLFRAHPEWAVGKKGSSYAHSRNQLLLDLTCEKAVEYVFKSIAKLLKKYDISYVKWDVNRSITECFSNTLAAERQGEFMHRYVLGVYSLAEKLTSEFPHVLFEGCSGGGGRFDAGMLYYFPQIWTSDDTDAYERARIQWGTSICYPVSAMSCHVSVCPNHQTGRTVPLSTRAAVATLGAFGFELDPSKMTEEEKCVSKCAAEDYRKIQDLALCGDLYRLSDPFNEICFCEMLVSKDKKKAYIEGERLRGKPWDNDSLIKLQGLDESKTYYIKELDIKASGKALVSIGLLMPSLGDYESWKWHISAIEG